MEFAPKFPQNPKHPDHSCSSSSASSSPTSVLPNKEKKRCLPPSVDRKGVEMKKNRSLPQCVDQRQVEMKKKRKVIEKTTSPPPPPPPLSPTSLRRAMLKIQFKDTIFKAEKYALEKSKSNPAFVQKELATLERRKAEEEQRVKAQLVEKKRLDDIEAERKKAQLEKERIESEKKREAIAKERQRREEIPRQRQRRHERRSRERMEAVAARRDKPYCCTLREIGIVSGCDHADSLSYWGGQYRRPLEQLGLFMKEDCLLKEVELEEGEIYEEEISSWRKEEHISNSPLIS